MMIIRYLLLFLLTFFVIGSGNATRSQQYTYTQPPAPVLASINIMDRNGFSETISNPDRLKQYENVNFFDQQPYEKVLRIFSRDECGDIHAYITSYHPNGHLKQYLEVINNRASGTYREWHPNGILKLDTLIIGGEADISEAAEKTWLFDQCSRVWDEEGNLIAEISYVKGELKGPSNYFHSDGALWKRMEYQKDKLEGPTEIFLANGDLLQVINYKNGVKEGPSKRFWNANCLAGEEEFCEGRLMKGRYFNLKGEQISSIDGGYGFRVIFGKSCISELQEFSNGIQEGAVKVFDDQGNLVRLSHIRNGVKHGEEIEYDAYQKPKLSIEWSEGKIQGLVKTWYPNGVQESQREMSNNKKNGVLTGWYENGSIMLMEEYDQNKLVRGEYFMPGEQDPISVVRTGKGTATLFDSQGNFLRKIEYNNGKPLLD